MGNVGNTDVMSVSDPCLAADLAHEAGQLLLAIRDEVGFDIPSVLGDAGDLRANTFLLQRLHAERPGDAVLSEESEDDLQRLNADRVWIIDPLDGTWEFSRPCRMDWAVHVALWQRFSPSFPLSHSDSPQGAITAAAVALPARGEVHRSDVITTPSSPQSLRSAPLRITASAHRPPAVLEHIRQHLDIELVRIGSAGAKAMAVVRGDVDAYIHAGGQWEWDSAAPAGVAQAAGLHTSRLDGSPLRYNQPNPYLPDLLLCRSDIAEPLLAAIGLTGETSIAVP